MRKTYKVGLIGLGGIAKGAHMSAYGRMKNVELAAICDIVPSKIEAFKQRYQLPDDFPAFTDYHDLLNMEGLDYVDIFYHHRMDPETPLEETMGALAHAVSSGKALYVGLSNYNGEQLRSAEAILRDLKCPFIINQNRYSILDRGIDNNGLKKTSVELGKGIIAFSPLAQGLLTDRYLLGIPEDSRVRTDGRFLNEKSLTEEKLAKVRALADLARERGQSLAQMALSWILRDGCVTSVLIGTSKSSQILDCIGAVSNTSFTDEELALIDKISL